MIIAVIIVRVLAFNFLPKRTFSILWAIVAARLLIPCSLPSPLSVYSIINHAGIVPQDIDKGILSNAISQNAVNSLSYTKLPWLTIWAFGFIICATYFVGAYIKCKKEFADYSPVDNNVINDWMMVHKIKRNITVRLCNRIKAPVTYGVFHPVILLPNLPNWTDTKKWDYVLQHEYIHIKQFDILIKLLLTLNLCIYWFNPLIWVAYILANRDMEFSCDETVIHYWGEEIKSAYALTLIDMEEQKLNYVPLSSGFGKSAIKKE